MTQKKTTHLLLAVIFTLNVSGFSLALASEACNMECCASTATGSSADSARYEPTRCCDAADACDLEDSAHLNPAHHAVCSLQYNLHPVLAKAGLSDSGYAAVHQLSGDRILSGTFAAPDQIPIYLSNLSIIC